MKKFLFLILTVLVTVAADAQIFTQKEIRDKFDDVVLERDIKTLIAKNDTTFIIEEKGKEPVTYKILFEHESMGSKDNIVQLVGNVYGYEEYCNFITHRVVTDQFGTKLLYEFCWIEKASMNGNSERTIYSIIY